MRNYGYRKNEDKSLNKEGFRINGEFKVFSSLKALNDWLYGEKLSSPFEEGGGERVRVSRKEALKLLGKRQFDLSVEFFEIDNFVKYEL